MPLVLILIGMRDGTSAFCLLGVFIGPALLAVAYAVLRNWTIGEKVRAHARLTAPLVLAVTSSPAVTSHAT